jgi:hypothetical protein
MTTNRELIAEYYPDLLVLDPEYFDAAIMGVVTRIGLEAVCYNTDRILDILVEKEGMSEEEAIEHFDYNIAGSYVGEHTPVFLAFEIE